MRFLQIGLLGLLGGLAIFAVLLTAAARIGQSKRPDASGAYQGTPLDGPAADFRLVNQNGVKVALTDFAGQVVVLAFLDSLCKEVCPLTAVHLRAARQALGDDVESVIFLGVNVNLEVNGVADVAATTQKWRLDEIPTWHFLTGSAEELQPVWKAYDILVLPASVEGEELVHTPGVYLIDRTGRQRWYVSTPFDDSGTPQWTAPLSELLVKHIRELLSER